MTRNSPADDRRNRRNVLKTAAVGALTVGFAGCTGNGDGNGNSNGNGNGDDGGSSIFIPGLYDLSGPTAEVGVPTANGSRDAIAYINNNDLIEGEIDHEWVDYAYDIENARQNYDDWSQDGPPAVLGWGTPDTTGLAPQNAREEIVYVSASYSEDLMIGESTYNFFGNLDYSSQNRAMLQWINDNDPGASVATVTALDNPFGTQVEDDTEEYAADLDLTHEGFINLSLTANSASTQVSRAADLGVDYVLGHLIAAAFQVLAQEMNNEFPEAELLGTTWSIDEIRVSESPEIYEGTRTVNAFKTFDEVANSDTRGAEAINTAFEENRDTSMDDTTVANLHYVRGFIHSLVLMRAIQNAQDSGGDPTSGSDLRQGMFDIDDWNVWGLAEPFDFREDDRRATMRGRVYQVVDGEMEFETTVELPRETAWIQS